MAKHGRTAAERIPAAGPGLVAIPATFDVESAVRRRRLWPVCAVCRAPVEELCRRDGILHISFVARCHGRAAHAVLDLTITMTRGFDAAFEALRWKAMPREEWDDGSQDWDRVDR